MLVEKQPHAKTAREIFSTELGIIVGRKTEALTEELRLLNEKKDAAIQSGENPGDLNVAISGIIFERGKLNELQPKILSILDTFRVGDVSLDGEVELKKDLPTILINKEERVILINGRTKRFSGNIVWKTLLFLAETPNKDVDMAKIIEITKKDGSSKTSAQKLSPIHYLRRILEEDYKKPKTLVKSGRHGELIFRLNANVEFVTEPLIKTSEKPKKKDADLSVTEEELARTLLAINKDETEFKIRKFISATRIIFKDKITSVEPRERKKKLYSSNSNQLRIRKNLIRKINDYWNIPEGNIPPQMSGLMKWIKKNKMYGRLSLEDLILVLQRKLSFQELQIKAGLRLARPKIEQKPLLSNSNLRPGVVKPVVPARKETIRNISARPTNYLSRASDVTKQETQFFPYSIKLASKEWLMIIRALIRKENNWILEDRVSLSKEGRDALIHQYRELINHCKAEGIKLSISGREVVLLHEKITAMARNRSQFVRQNADIVASTVLALRRSS